MQLRATLLIAACAAVLLPWGGWQLVQQVEALLREGQERAQVGAAQALAGAVVATAPGALPARGGLYLHPLAQAAVLDGAATEWTGLVGERSADGRLAVTAAESDGVPHLLIEVVDATRARVDAGSPLFGVGDRVDLAIGDAAGVRRYTLGNAAPGPLQVAGADPSQAPVGEWQETAGGYRIELRLPRLRGRGWIAIAAHDVAQPGAPGSLVALGQGADEPLALLRREPELDALLSAVVPAGARVRVVSPEGWVLGRAGELGAIEGATTTVGPAGNAPAPWQAWLYDLLLAPPAESAADFAPRLPRLDAPVVWQALGGLAGSTVRASAAANTVIVAAAVPLVQGGQVRGALLLEQGSDALLVLANRAVFGVMAASLFAVLVAVTIVLAYAGVLSLRIRRLRDAAERALRPDGRLEPKLPHLAARDDLGDLSRSFGTLLAEIGAYTDYLRTLASKLSHELNTPLAIVRSSLDNLEHEALPVSARTYAQRAREGAERLSAILRSMSEASRMERAIQSAEGEDFDLAAVVRNCVDAYRDLLAPRTLLADLPGGAVSLHGAPEMIAQALDKLVDNARSFTPPHGTVRIRLRALEVGAELAVVNDGPPLPERMQEKLFDSLVSVRTEIGGRGDAPHLGLGLFVVRLVAELHRGRAEARNLPDDGGVEFCLTLAGMPRRPMREANRA